MLCSCSVKKDTIFSRTYHRFTTKYNVLFNAEKIFEKGLQSLEQKEILKDTLYSLEHFVTSDKLLKIAEKKSVKAIQKHSMLIKNKQKNPQIYKAYKLLGKTRYHTKRFAPALEAFSVIIYQDAQGVIKNDAKIWIAKIKIKLHDEEFAIGLLSKMLAQNDVKTYQKALIHKGLFTAYKQLDTLHKAVEHLKKYINFETDSNKIYRAKIMVSQIYQKQRNPYKAKRVLQQIITKNTPAKYKVLALYKFLKYAYKKPDLLFAKKELLICYKKLKFLPYQKHIAYLSEQVNERLLWVD